MENIDIMEIIRQGLNVKCGEHFTRDCFNKSRNEFKFIKQDVKTALFVFNDEFDMWVEVEDSEDIGFFVDCPSPIVKLPFKPNGKEPFVFINMDGAKVHGFFNSSNQLYLLLYKMGNCYACESDAIKDEQKWVLYYQRITDLLK